MSSESAKHRKQKRAPARRPCPARHRKPSPVASALQNHPTRSAAAVTGAVLDRRRRAGGDPLVGLGGASARQLCSARPAIGGLSLSASPSGHQQARPPEQRRTGPPRPLGQQLGRRRQASPSRTAKPAPPGTRHARAEAAPPVYANPLRAVSGLVPERIDQGVDFSGAGPDLRAGDAVVTNA